jgi:antitoxin YefM
VKNKGAAMLISASSARLKLISLIKQVNDDKEPIVITSTAGNAVLVSQSEWENLLETLYLLGHSESRKKILQSRADISQGKGVKVHYKKDELFKELESIDSEQF